MKIKMVTNLLLIVLLSISFVSGVGFAPISVQGVVSFNGIPVKGASLLLSIDDNSKIFAPVVFTDEVGYFFSVITVPDPLVIDIKVSISYDDEVFVEMLNNAQSWGKYSQDFDFSDDILETNLDTSPVSSPSSLEFEADMDAILDGDALEDDVLREKYDIVIEPYNPLSPVVEKPSIISQKKPEKFWDFWALFGLVIFVAGLGFLLRKHDG